MNRFHLRLSDLRPTLFDRYLMRQFLRNFAIFFFSFTGLYVVVDTFNNLDEFLTYAEKQGSLARVILEYYGFRSMWFFDLTGSTLTLIAAMFTIAALHRTNELTALLAAGISKRRIVASLLVATVVITILAALNRELLLPSVRDKLATNAQDMVGDGGLVLKPRYDYKTNVFLDGQRTFVVGQRIEKPAFRLPRALSDYGDLLTAESAVYEAPTGDRPGGYRLQKLLSVRDLASRPSLALNDEPVLLTPHDAKWLAADECFVVSDVSFELLEAGQAWRQFSSTRDLIAGLHNESLGFDADVRVRIHARLLQPILDVSLIFLGLPLVLTREVRNIFLAIGRCALIVLLFMVTVLACHSLGMTGWIGPAKAAWLPLFIFIPLAVALSEPLRE